MATLFLTATLVCFTKSATITSPAYGQSGTSKSTVGNAITGIASWAVLTDYGAPYDGCITNLAFKVDHTATSDIMGYHATTQTCTPFDVAANDYIHGYRVLYIYGTDKLVYGLQFVTALGQTFTCPANLDQISNSYLDSGLIVHAGYYLSKVQAAAIMVVDGIQFEFTSQPTASPTSFPSNIPSMQPTETPTDSTQFPSNSPSAPPTKTPSESPSVPPTKTPSNSPSDQPTIQPSVSPSGSPTPSPTDIASAEQQDMPETTNTDNEDDHEKESASMSSDAPQSWVLYVVVGGILYMIGCVAVAIFARKKAQKSLSKNLSSVSSNNGAKHTNTSRVDRAQSTSNIETMSNAQQQEQANIGSVEDITPDGGAEDDGVLVDIVEMIHETPMEAAANDAPKFNDCDDDVITKGNTMGASYLQADEFIIHDEEQ